MNKISIMYLVWEGLFSTFLIIAGMAIILKLLLVSIFAVIFGVFFFGLTIDMAAEYNIRPFWYKYLKVSNWFGKVRK